MERSYSTRKATRSALFSHPRARQVGDPVELMTQWRSDHRSESTPSLRRQEAARRGAEEAVYADEVGEALALPEPVADLRSKSSAHAHRLKEWGLRLSGSRSFTIGERLCSGLATALAGVLDA